MAKNRYPIILAHGIARFDFITETFLKRLNLFFWERSFAKDRLHYFKGIAPYLREQGFDVYPTSVSFASDVTVRAGDLHEEVLRVLAESRQEKVHIIGHSMGGLDARSMIVDHDADRLVASMTSIGTPHLGTSFANWGLSHGGHEIIVSANQILDLSGFKNLTLEAMSTFNERCRHAEASNQVVYQTYSAVQMRDRIFGPIQGSWQIIHDHEGENDGLVSLQSQRWTKELVSGDGAVKQVGQYDFPLAADHLNQVGWWDIRELLRVRWWRTGLIREKNRFETAVKNAYLHIAEGLVNIERLTKP